jgi:hypothetical protein
MTDPRAETAAALRARVAAFDAATDIPPGLAERVITPARPSVRPARRRWSTPVVAAAAVLGVVVGLVAAFGWQARRASVPQLTGSAAEVTMTVYNAEVACQKLRTIECGLTVRRSPHTVRLSEPPVGRVWHGDQVTADCVVTDGKPVLDEDGVTSPRWYRVRLSNNAVGYLPAVRTRNTIEVSICPVADVPR